MSHQSPSRILTAARTDSASLAHINEDDISDECGDSDDESDGGAELSA
jgi:hypothetical protein